MKHRDDLRNIEDVVDGSPDAPAPCRRCTECEGQEHHFLGLGEHDVGTDEVYFPCKHCDARAPMCDLCGGGFWPVVDDGRLCAECKFDQED